MTMRSNPGWASRLAANLQQEVPSAMRGSMKIVEEEAKRLIYLGHPDHLERKTGALQRSIHTSLSEDGGDISATVGSDLVYAPVHEFGTVITGKNGSPIFIPPRPFLTPAFETKKGDVLADFKRGFQEIVQGVTTR